MIDDALTNPPLPEWNELSDEHKAELDKAWEFSSCPHACGGDSAHFYDTLRRILREREKTIFESTMGYRAHLHN